MRSKNVRVMSILALFILPMVVSAQKITEQQALLKAQQFMKGKVFKSASKARGSQGNTNETSAFYVFNVEDNGGFVIVSGDERTPAILGYGDSGNLDLGHLPSNVQWLMDYYKDGISNLTDAAVGAERHQAPAKSEIAPLIATQWGQDSPFNDQCPMVGSQRPLTGCVAATMAQVMNYFQWPKGSTATIPAYTTRSLGIVCPELPPTTFNWTSLTDADKARLFLYCGQAMEMDYRKGGSSANGNTSGAGLHKYFDYDVNARTLSRNNYTEDEWTELLYAELKASRPIIYNGEGTGGGHSFICDGYKNGLFHINWGWKGLYDGHFLISNLKPGSDDFTKEQFAVVGIQPNTGDAPQMPVLNLDHFSELSQTTFTRSGASQPFVINSINAFLASAVQTDVKCEVRFRLYRDSKPVSSAVLGSSYPRTYLANDVIYVWSSSYYSGSLSFGAGLPDGTYRLVVVHRLDGSTDDYEPVQGANAQYIECVISGNTMTLRIVENTPLLLEEPEVILGDLNGDGEVDVTDVVELIDMVLSGEK